MRAEALAWNEQVARVGLDDSSKREGGAVARTYERRPGKARKQATNREAATEPAQRAL